MLTALNCVWVDNDHYNKPAQNQQSTNTPGNPDKIIHQIAHNDKTILARGYFKLYGYIQCSNRSYNKSHISSIDEAR
jgi:hypothetical protein